MSISSNSLFHFTNSKNKLFQILKEGFCPAYCWETITIQNKNLGQGVPLISFCDIPLSQVKDHLAKYGNYGIGLSLEWGIKNGLNPVFYLDDKSIVAKKIIDVGNFVFGTAKKQLEKKNTPQKSLDITDKIMESFIATICNMKNYRGDLSRKGKIEKNYKFYDEREWRFIPDEKIKPILREDKYLEARGKSGTKPILKDVVLNFSTSDIKYILVKDDSEIHQLLEHLHNLKFIGESHRDIEILGTKIITAKQIKEDF